MGPTQEGFEAEWREISFLTVDGDLINRFEIFDEADLDAALARFDRAQPAGTAAGKHGEPSAYEHFEAHFAARDWDAMAEILADDVFRDDRRRVVSAELRQGRDAEIANCSALAEIGVTHVTSTSLRPAGERLALVVSASRAATSEPRRSAPRSLVIVEIDADERIVAIVVFDPDDFDAAFAELDARYLAGEAAAHARTWSAIVRAYAAINRHELPPTTPDFESSRPSAGATFAADDLTAYLRAAWDLVPRQPRLHRSCASTERSRSSRHPHGEWDLTARASTPSGGRSCFSTVDGDLFSRCEIFDEADLDAALARFDELQPADATAGKRGKPSDRALSGVLLGPRLGRHGGATGRRLLQ